MTVKIYRSTDNSAPALSGAIGALIPVLDACLVNGYATASITGLVEVSTTVTATLAVANSTLRVGDVVTVAGASPAGANGNVTITSLPDSTHFTYEATAGLGTITGTITYKKTSAGWTKPFSGTNLAVYKQPAGTNQRYLRVDDTTTQSARFVGYEAMTDVNTGANPFPTSIQLSGGLYAQKSSTADSTVRPWILFTNEKIFYLLMNSTSVATGAAIGALVFGDIISYKTGDAYNTVAIGSVGTTYVAPTISAFNLVNYGVASGSLVGHYIARAYTATGTSVIIGKVTNTGFCGAPNYGGTAISRTIGGNFDSAGTTGMITMPYPNPVNGGLYLEKIWVTETGSIRGELPGIWAPMHYVPFDHQVPIIGAGPLAGKTFESYTTANSFVGQMMIETSNTW